jgi:molecular chaperone DnaJ
VVLSKPWSSHVKDPYHVLAIPRAADERKIKEAYRRLARKHHPDVNPGDKGAEERFKDVQIAYDLLSDPKKREAYDRFGAAAFQPGGGDGASGFGWDPSAPGTPSFDEIFGAGSLDDILASLFGGRGHRPDERQPSTPHGTLELTLDEALHGTEREVRYEHRADCPTCAGRGTDPAGKSSACAACKGTGRNQMKRGSLRLSTRCSACGGSGKSVGPPCPACAGRRVVERETTVRVRVPAGVEDGATLRIPGRAGAPPLLLQVRIAADPRFERHDRDLHVDLPISLAEAALGAEVPVPTPAGEARIRIPPGTPSGRKFRLAGRGLPDARRGNGDVLAIVRIVPPPTLSTEEKQVLEEFDRLSRFNPRRAETPS